MHFERVLALVTLAELPRVGERRLAHVAATARDRGLRLAEVLTLAPAALAADYRLPAAALQRLIGQRFWHTAHCRALVARLAACGARICTPVDPGYPRRWRSGAPAPPLAYVYGATELLDLPAVAVLSSRGTTDQTVTASAHLARAAARDGCVLVTGGMKTTHRIAAATVRAAGAARIVVLDRGLFAAFGGRPELDPFGIGPARGRFDPHQTLVVSIFRPDNHASPRNGRRRDELIVALGDVVVALGARPGGEVERVCLQALGRGQRVLNWRGANAALRRAGAEPLDEASLSGGLKRFLPPPG